MSRNILTIGDLQPDRPTVTINRRSPDGWWQRWKFTHLDVLLRWSPVRFDDESNEYAIRTLDEFGLRTRQRLQRLTSEVGELQGATEPASIRRQMDLLRELAGMLVDAPGHVLDSLAPHEHLQILLAFPAAVTGQTPTTQRPENPPTSDASSPASTASTVPGTG